MQDAPARSGIRHYEDLQVGIPSLMGDHTVTREEIIAFARAYDPQPIHLDEEAARKSIVGGLCAAGMHTCAITMRMLCDGLFHRTASLGSPGMDEVRWLKPVRPGTRLSVRHTILEKRLLASRPGVGLCRVLVELLDHAGDVLSTWRTNQFIRARNDADAPAQAGSGAKRARAMTSLWDTPADAVGVYPDLYFEDRNVGETMDVGSHTFTEPEIIEFARQFDPQPFHLDETAARSSLFGHLCASGWQTASFFILSLVTTRQRANAEARAQGIPIASYGPSPGFRSVQWLKPVYVGDTVSYRARLIEKTDLKSMPGRGLLASNVQGRNQKGEVVFSIISQVLAERRTPLRD